MASMKSLATLLFAASLTLSACASAQEAEIVDPAWLQQVKDEAVSKGVSPATVSAALDYFTPDPRVIDYDRKQPESTITFATYRRNVVNEARVRKGAALMEQYAPVLQALQERTGVPPQMVVTLWAVESSYGASPGNFETVTSLATLAYEGRRANFFRGELMAALKIIDQEGMQPSQLRGSWAGAMGQCQFMPTTYLRYAVDGDGDGRRDIWTNTTDVLASIAYYLAAEGWNGDLTWGRPVRAPGAATPYVGLDKKYALADWAKLGVTSIDGSPLPRRDLQASLVQPDGEEGDSYLVYDNLRALMRWNKSTYFAVSAGLLADRIKGY